MSTTNRLVPVLLLLMACSSDGTGPNSVTTQWILDDIVLPANASQATGFGFDLDLDGTADNQLGSVFAALVSSGLDFQTGMDAGIASGDIVQLIEFEDDDATLTSDPAAQAKWYVGQPTTGFTTGPHQVDNAYAAGTLTGPLSAAAFTSTSPAIITANPVSVFIPLKLFASTSIIYLPLEAAHVQWSFSGTSAMVSGEVHGSLRTEDVDNLLVPAMAEAFNAVILPNPSAATAQTLLSLFDNGGCSGGVADDNVLAVCEVATNSLMQSLLAPDVLVYGGSGGFNALSVGVGFTAVRTTF